MPQSEHIEKPLDVQQVAELLAVSRQTVVQLIEDGWINAFDVSAGGKRRRWRIQRADLRTFMESQSSWAKSRREA